MDIDFFKIVSGRNDLILINFLNTGFNRLEKLLPLTRALCSRKTGVGGNGVICLFRGEEHPFRIRFFRPDGQESVLINDALFCLARYIFDSAMTGSGPMVETLQGERKIEILDSMNFRISLGTPLTHKLEPLTPDPEQDFLKVIRINNRNHSIIPVFLGKKGAVFIDGGEYRGRRKEIAKSLKSSSKKKDPCHPIFVRIEERDEIRVNAPPDKLNTDTASGCAIGGIGAVLSGIAESELVIRSRGTRYYFEWNREKNEVFLTGSAEYTFSGSYYFDEEHTF